MGGPAGLSEKKGLLVTRLHRSPSALEFDLVAGMGEWVRNPQENKSNFFKEGHKIC